MTMRNHESIETIRRQSAPGAQFPSMVELRAMSLGRLRKIDIKSSEQEQAVQIVMNEKMKSAPLARQVYRGGIPDILTKDDEIKYQKIIDQREASLRPQDHQEETEMQADIVPSTVQNEPIEPEVEPEITAPVEPVETEAELEARIAALQGQADELTA